jgi:TPR repeat protein
MERHKQARKNICFIAVIIVCVAVASPLNAFADLTDTDSARLEQAEAAARIKDFETVATLLRPLAEQGNSVAQYKLAGLYRSGRGVQKNLETAFYWMLRSAILENSKAQYNVGSMNEKGWGVEKNFVEALKWYRVASGQGHYPKHEHL